MTRRTLFPAIAAVLAALTVSFTAATTKASAQQNPNCCFYIMDIQGFVPGCIPFKFFTKWDCGGQIIRIARSFDNNGIFAELIGAPQLPPCPPACKLIGISLNDVDYIGPNENKIFKLGNCCYNTTFGFDANGCISIKVVKC